MSQAFKNITKTLELRNWQNTRQNWN